MTEATFETTTARLRLRRPSERDRAFHCEVHSDPRLYAHAPHAVGTVASNASFFAAILAHWAEWGFGYWVAEDRESRLPLGWVGVQQRDDHLNLCYRFVTGAQGRGLAREAARAAVAMATQWRPHDVVRALVKDHNTPSARTAEAAGLVRTNSVVALADDLAGEPPSRVFEAPQVRRVDTIAEAAREELLDLWCRVNDAGGSVGFLPGASRAQVARTLAMHEAQMAAGDAFGGALTLPDGQLVGWAWWVRGPNPLIFHGRWLQRVMVDPSRQGRGLGLILMAGMHRLAREEGVELLQLAVRSGSGASSFYRQCGYVEVGRVPGAIRVAPGDDRDEVTMARRVDGAPLVAHGGS